MEESRRFTLEAGFDLLLILLGSVVAAVSWSYGFGTFAKPGPGLYPFFVGVVIAACAALNLVAGLRRPPLGEPLDAHAWKKLGFMAATFCLWVLAMPLAGYVGVTLLATFAFAKILGLEGWVKPLAIAAGTALFIYLLFDHWLYIDLPRGIFG